MGWGERQDKRYRECMAEIVGVLQRYDMAGTVHIVSKERAMFRHHMPTWSVIRLLEDGGGVRIRSKLEDFPSREAQHEAMTLSAHVVFQLRDMAANTFGSMDVICKKLEEHFEIEHDSFADFDPETTQ